MNSTVAVLNWEPEISPLLHQRAESVSNTNYDASVDRFLGTALLRTLPEGYRLECPIVVELYLGPDYYWVIGEGGFLHGTGESEDAAIEDYRYAVVEYYQMLQREKDVLAEHLMKHLETLERIISEK